jgi:hypothetical protein
VTTADYRAKVNEEHPDYRAIHSTRIEKATRTLITAHALEYDDLLRQPGSSLQWSKAELRRRHNDEWREILRGVPGTLRDVRLGLTLERIKAWPWS